MPVRLLVVSKQRHCDGPVIRLRRGLVRTTEQTPFRLWILISHRPRRTAAASDDENPDCAPPSGHGQDRAMFKRRRFKQQLTLQDRLSAWVKQVKEDAASLPPGPERDALLKKARQAELANHLHDWVKSPGLQPPK